MEIIGYGEDSLTLWALKYRLKDIRDKNDDSDPSECKSFYRPSFGRGRSCFGEFDFILLSRNRIYLGESKWDGTPSTRIRVPKEQSKRHRIFRLYIECCRISSFCKADEKAKKRLADCLNRQGVTLPKESSRLCKNVMWILDHIQEHFKGDSNPTVVDRLLYFHLGDEPKWLPRKCGEFSVVPIKYPEDLPKGVVFLMVDASQTKPLLGAQEFGIKEVTP